MINIYNYVCLHCNHKYSSLEPHLELARCPRCGSVQVGKNYQPYNLKINEPTNRW